MNRPSSGITESSNSCRKILIVRLGSLGDIVHAIPSQQSIKRHWPQSEIHWLTEPPYDSLLNSVCGISKVWVADTQKWRRRIFSLREGVSLIQSLRRERFDVVLDFQGLIKSALLGRLSGARQVVGFRPERFKEPAAQYFYSDTVVGDDGSQPHAVEINFQLARFLGCSEESLSPAVPLETGSRELQYVNDHLGRLGIQNPILINPGAGWVTKLWPAKSYAQLFVKIREETGLPVIFTYGPGEEALIETIRDAAAPHFVATFPTDFLQFSALCRRSQLLVGGDTGPLHLAVSLGTPTVAILGPTASWRNGPFNPQDEIIKRDLPCSNSYKRTCDQFICMDIPVQQVFDAVVRRLSP